MTTETTAMEGGDGGTVGSREGEDRGAARQGEAGGGQNVKR